MNSNRTLNHLTTAVLLLDTDLNTVYANPAAEHLFEMGATQLKGNSFKFFLPDTKSEEEFARAQAEEFSFTKREAPLNIPGRKSITVDYTVTPTNEGLLLEIQPVDRILRINREEALLSAHTTSRELVRNLAHEVKNPLGGIKGAAQLLAPELNDDQHEYVDVIIAETERLTHLVDQLLGPSRPFEMALFNIHRATERVATLIAAETQTHDEQAITLIRDYDPSIPDIAGDHDQLLQAVLNIARNAMQSLQQAAIPNACITLRTRIQRHFTIGKTPHKVICRLDIEDNGPGIDPDIAERIFYPMISGREQGSGLGLHIAQSIVNRHNGLIECASQPGETRFSIFLPLEHAHEQ